MEKINENIDYMKDGWNRAEYIEAELPKLEKEILIEKDPLKKSILEARKEYLRREINYYNNNGRELVKGAVVGAVATGAAIVATVTTTAIAVGGAVISAITDKEEKIELSKIQLTQLQETAPEFYRENKELFVISDTANTKTSDVLSMAENFYSNAKTPDEQLSNLVGNVVGGVVAGKVANSISSKNNNQKIKSEILKEVNSSNLEINKNFDSLPESTKEMFYKYEKTGWKGQVSGGPSNAGKKYLNDGRNAGEILPNKVEYREFDINPKSGSYRDGIRFVRGSDGSVYYTTDHYKTFIQIK